MTATGGKLTPDIDEGASRPESNAARVNSFHRAVDTRVPAMPTVPPFQTLHLRKTLISEEFREVCEAIDEIDNARLHGEDAAMQAVIRLAHELADLLYVAYGGFSDTGIDADAVFAEVHRANMQKARGPKRTDGKALKPSDWQPANVAAIVARQLPDSSSPERGNAEPAETSELRMSGVGREGRRRE